MVRTHVLGLVLAAALAGSVSTTAPAVAVAPDAGASGIGDPYFPGYGNGGYDVEHYAIGVTYDVDSGRLVGDTTVTAQATQDLSRFNLDLELTPRRAWVDGTEATVRERGREVTVTPATPLPIGTQFDVRMTYAGVPGKRGDGYLGGWNETPDGAFAAGEPEVATLWFPSNDHPVDKATYDVRVTTDATKQVVSNGTLVDTVDAGNGLATTHWQTRDPMTTYLATVAIGDYDLVEGTSDAGTPYLLAISKHLSRRVHADALASVLKTPRIVDFYGRPFGAHPFEATGAIVVNAPIPFALENQTRPIYPASFFRYGENDNVVAHELAHQWFGDSVSLRRWRDTWLNEGFATWSAWRWGEHHGDVGLPRQFRWAVRSYTYNEAWGTPVQPSPRDNIFAGAVYTRGGMTLQALAQRVGPRTQERILRTWATQHQYGHGTTRQFVRLAEQVSGADLAGFFRAWLHQPKQPARTKANGFPRSMR